MIRPSTLVIASLALCVAPLAEPAGAAGNTKGEKASRAERRLEKFEGKARVVEVQVPVNVVGKDGESIRGLTADDFEVFDRGKKRQIIDFEVLDLALIEPGETRTEVDRAVPASARRHFLLLFDLSFSSPNLIIRAREAAREFVLEHLHPTDLVAVAMHTVEGGARILVTFTPDRAQVARAIDTLGAPRLSELARRDPLLFLIDDPDATGFAAASDVADLVNDQPTNVLQESVAAHIRVIGRQIAKMERSFSRGRISSWSRSMGDLARFMDSVRGRKHVVYFSEGFDGQLLLGKQPSANDAELQQDLANIQGGQLGLIDTDDIYGNIGLQNEMARMLEEFRRADCVIQAVDISGLRADGEAIERMRNVGQDALFYIANDTGGELYQDVTDFGADLSRVLRKSEVTYLLTFEASDVIPDGSYRRIKVKSKYDGPAKLTHRQGYYAPRPFEELHPLEKSLMAADVIATATSESQLDLNVLAAPFRADVEAYVPVIIEVGGDKLLWEHRDDEMQVEFYAYVTDERGAMRDFFTQMVTLDLSRGRTALARTGLKYYGHLDLGPGDYLVRVLVRNSQTGRTGSESVRLSIPEFGLAEPFVLPPFFLEAGREWLLVRERDQSYQRNVVYPFTVNGDPYIPAAGPSLRNDDQARLCLVAYNLGDGILEVSARVLAEDGQPVEGGRLALVERTVTGIVGLDKLLATFSPQGLNAGRYTLLVDVMEPATGSTETNSIKFTVYN